MMAMATTSGTEIDWETALIQRAIHIAGIAIERNTGELYRRTVFSSLGVGRHHGFGGRVIGVATGLPLDQNPHPQPAITVGCAELPRLFANECVT